MAALPKLLVFSIALAAAPATVYRAATSGALDGESMRERQRQREGGGNRCCSPSSSLNLHSPSSDLCARVLGPPTPHARLTLAGLGAVLAVNLVREREKAGACFVFLWLTLSLSSPSPRPTFTSKLPSHLSRLPIHRAHTPLFTHTQVLLAYVVMALMEGGGSDGDGAAPPPPPAAAERKKDA